MSGPEVTARVLARLDSLTKPPGSLGRLEELVVQYAGIRGVAMPEIRRKALYVFCGDHGVVEEGVSAYPQKVTCEMVRNFLRGGAAINVLCRRLDITPVIVDVGVAAPPEPGVQNARIAAGTRNFTREPAMTREQAEAALQAGRALAVQAPADLAAAGEMGIGNTTSAAALAAALLGLEPEAVAGRGAGVDDAGLARKCDAIRRGLRLHRPDPSDPIGVLAAVGGFEIGAMAGFYLGCAEARVPVVIDGFIATAAALLTRAIQPGAGSAMIFAHRSAERGHSTLLEHLGARPLLDLGMRLGEGTGAALAMQLVETAVALYRQMATFQEAGVSSS